MQAFFTHAIKFVGDMDHAVAFYRDTLGLPLRFASPYWSEFDTGTVTLALHPASERNPAGSTQVGFTTPGLEAIYASREAAGLSFTAPPLDEHGTLLSRLLDSEGAEISLSGARA
ncbi:MAG TPA: VOC family protein [Caulobacteraceae bacterium]|jgi:lactoylglutathione lyase|nr:VOC family protein [Caulobacteraceae bacterium]